MLKTVTEPLDPPTAMYNPLSLTLSRVPGTLHATTNSIATISINISAVFLAGFNATSFVPLDFLRVATAVEDEEEEAVVGLGAAVGASKSVGSSSK